MMIISLCLLVLVSGCDKLKQLGQKKTQQETAPVQEVIAEEQPIPVATERVQTGAITQYRTFNGDVYPVTTMAILPETSGKVIETLVKEGDKVGKDQVVARLDQSRPGMNYNPSDVKAPMSGTLLSWNAQVGGMASPAASMGTIISEGDVEVRFNVVERFLSLVHEKQKVVLSFDAYPGEIFPATITRLSPVVDGVSRTRKVYCRLDAADERIIPGMYARIQLIVQQNQDALLVPENAIVRHESGKFLYVVVDGRAKALSVETGIIADGKCEVTKGLDRDAVIIVKGQDTLKDGSAVTIAQ